MVHRLETGWKPQFLSFSLLTLFLARFLARRAQALPQIHSIQAARALFATTITRGNIPVRGPKRYSCITVWTFHNFISLLTAFGSPQWGHTTSRVAGFLIHLPARSARQTTTGIDRAVSIERRNFDRFEQWPRFHFLPEFLPKLSR
jgi:hypothetical protein